MVDVNASKSSSSDDQSWAELLDQMNTVMKYLNAYFVPVVCFVGISLNVLSIIIANNHRWHGRASRTSITIGAVANIFLLTFRGVFGMWTITGLKFSTGGNAYLNVDSISTGTCKAIRGFSSVSELVTVAAVSFETIEFYNMFRAKKARVKTSLVAILVYYSLALLATILAIIFTLDLLKTSDGYSCDVDVKSTLGISTVILMQSMVYVLPAIVHFANIFIGCGKRLKQIPSEEKAVVTKVVAYSLLQLPIYSMTVVRIAFSGAGADYGDILGDASALTLAIALLLPTTDFLVTLIFVQQFRNLLRSLFCGKSKVSPLPPVQVEPDKMLTGIEPFKSKGEENSPEIE